MKRFWPYVEFVLKLFERSLSTALYLFAKYEHFSQDEFEVDITFLLSIQISTHAYVRGFQPTEAFYLVLNAFTLIIFSNYVQSFEIRDY